MIRKCDLKFQENDILTKEMLSQMNSEPKWLVLDQYPIDTVGAISGFNFIISGEKRILTKGNLLVYGNWYRMLEDFVIETDGLTPGQIYQIYLKKQENTYVIHIEEKTQNFTIKNEDIPIAKFKYESQIAFRIPTKLEELEDMHKRAYLHDISLRYYNHNGIQVCSPVIANCILDCLRNKTEKTLEEYTIMYQIYNTGTISISSIAEYIEADEVFYIFTDKIIKKLRDRILRGKIKYESVNYEKIKELKEENARPKRGW